MGLPNLATARHATRRAAFRTQLQHAAETRTKNDYGSPKRRFRHATLRFETLVGAISKRSTDLAHMMTCIRIFIRAMVPWSSCPARGMPPALPYLLLLPLLPLSPGHILLEGQGRPKRLRKAQNARQGIKGQRNLQEAKAGLECFGKRMGFVYPYDTHMGPSRDRKG